MKSFLAGLLVVIAAALVAYYYIFMQEAEVRVNSGAHVRVNTGEVPAPEQ